MSRVKSKEQIKSESAKRPSVPTNMPANMSTTTKPLPEFLQASTTPRLRQQHLLAIQSCCGNAYVGQYLRQAKTNQIAREVDYNKAGEGANVTDPEETIGVLPFTENGWDGLSIGRQISQLNTAASHFDESRCVEVSFLVALIQRGPEALKDMISSYLERYRDGLRRVSTAENIKRWYRHSIRRLSPMVGKIDDQTLTFTDLAIIMQEMYAVYGEGDMGTNWLVGNYMARREGYTVEVINQDIFVQADAAALAQQLQPGELLSCRVEASKEGIGEYRHAIHIGRHPQTNALYLYDPFPTHGDQLVMCGDDLAEVTHYFTNFSEEKDETTGKTETFEEMRTFNVYAKLAPPTEVEVDK